MLLTLTSSQFCRESCLRVFELQLNGKITFIEQIIFINKFNLEKYFLHFMVVITFAGFPMLNLFQLRVSAYL